MNKLETKELTFSYLDKNVIENVSVTIDAGESWAFIGRNGVGKSTLLKCLCGLLKPCGGDVLIGGTRIGRLSVRQTAQYIAYVPQGNNRPVPPFTVREYVMMARYPYRNFEVLSMRNDKNRVDNALEIAGISHFAERMMATLSGGEFQAALIAGALAQETPFLLLDEPTTYLDPHHQENIAQMIKRINTQLGVSVVTVTHDINFALSAHNNVLALIDGKTAYCGTKKEFCANALLNLSKIFSMDFCVAEYSQDRRIYFAGGGS